RIWDQRPRLSRDGVLLRVVNSRKRSGDSQPVTFQAVAFSGDGQTCAAADKRGHLYLLYLRLNRFSLVDRGDPPGPSAHGLCFTRRRHEEVLCAAGNVVRAFDVDTHRNTAVLQGHQREVRSVGASGCGGLVLTQSADLTVLWDVKDWTRRRSLNAQESPLHEVRFNPMGDMCGILFRDSRVALWRTANFSFERELVAPEGLLRPGAAREELGLKHFALSDRRLVAGGSGGLLIAWSLTAPDRAPLALESPGSIAQLQLASLGTDGGSAASQGASTVVFVLFDDGRLMVVQLKGLQVLLTLDLQAQLCTTVAFEVGLDSKQLVLARSDGVLEVRDLQRTVASQQRSLQQRIQIGAPAEILQPTLKRIRYSHRQQLAMDSAESAEAEDEDDKDIYDEHGPALASGTSPSAPSRPGRSQRSGAQPVQGSAPSARPGRSGNGNADFVDDSISGFEAWESPSSRPSFAVDHPGLAANFRESSPSDREADSPRVRRTRLAFEDGGYGDLDVEDVAGGGSSFARRLQGMLRQESRIGGGAFPDTQRARLWRRLLQLPYNQRAYQELEALGTHRCFGDLRTQYPAHTRGTLVRLESLLSAVAHWFSNWAEATFLPALAFPFLKVFGDEPVLCFEAVLSVLLNWGRCWIEELPGPPLAELLRLDDFLAATDPQLHSHLRLACEAPHQRGSLSDGGAVHLRVLWPLLQTLLTEVLKKNQWLQLWDHLMAHWLEPELLHAAVVAFLKCSRASLLALPQRSPREVDQWVRAPQQVDMPRLLETMYALRADAAAVAPSALSPDDLLGGLLGALGSEGLAASRVPLPKGRIYPRAPLGSGAGAPEGAEPAAAAKARAAVHLTSGREQLVELHGAVERLSKEEARFRQQQEELLRSEEERRKVALAEEERLLEERRHMDETLVEKRLNQVKQLYEGMEQQLNQQQRARAAEGQQMLDDLRRRHRQRAYELEARLKEEA
ncbi:unnamed protein product, partial [Polarella glacialis]